MHTKEKILDAALELFSVQGYENTSVAAIAEAVGIKAPSLYKHFGNKQEIFEAILKKIHQKYQEQAAMLQLNGNLPELDAERYRKITDSELASVVLQMFRFFLYDPYAARCRRMMALEQYRISEAAELYREQYFLNPLAYLAELFRQLMKAEILKDADPEIMALQFYGPIFMLLSLCDHTKAQIPWAEAQLKEHILAFNRIYKRGV